MIYFRTCAFNAEKTIRRTIESVLNQTVTDWTYYILENGSNDGTRAIIEEYAKKDSRIVPYYNKVNRRYEENPDFWNMTQTLKDEDYFILLDADDYYSETFLEDVLCFMNKYNLDVAACGSIFIDEDGNTIGSTIQKQDFILKSQSEYDENFSYAHWNMRQVWGKIYAGSVARHRCELELPEWWPKAYGGDTTNVMQCLLASNGFGILAKGLHYYQVSNKSSSYKWTEGREDADVTLDTYAKKFLQEKAGYISDYNKRFLSIVYVNAIKDTIKVLLSADLQREKVVHVISKIFSADATKEILEYQDENGYGANAKEELMICRKILLDWTISNYKFFLPEGKEDAFLFFQTYGDVVEEILKTDIIDKLIFEKPGIVSSFLNGQVGSLVKETQEFVEKQKQVGSLGLRELSFCQNIYAYLGMEKLYILYSKAYIEELIQMNEIEAAKNELEEWMQLLPNDQEIKKFIEIVDSKS